MEKQYTQEEVEAEFLGVVSHYPDVTRLEFILALTLAKVDKIQAWMANKDLPPIKKEKHHDFYNRMEHLQNQMLRCYLNLLHPVPPPAE